MFERYNERARRTIFFARYEASRFGSPHIEPQHLFLAVVRENKDLIERFFGSAEAIPLIQQEIEARSEVRPRISTSVDLPLSSDSKDALSFAAEESQATGDRQIRPEHLLLGLLRLENSEFVQSLRKHGIVHASIEPEPRGTGQPEAPMAQSLEPATTRFRNLLEAAARTLALVDEHQAALPARPGGWCPKQILGHLIDSVSNNHQRFVRALIQPELDWPSYEQERWVNTQHYATAGWDVLVRLWTSYNQHLLWIVLHIPEEKTGTICRIGTHAPMTLRELIAGYLDHMENHLKQIEHRNSASAAS